MYNWSVDEGKFKKNDPQAHKLWKLQQMVNYGLQGKKLNKKLVRKHWKKLIMDSPTRKYLRFLLWQNKKTS